jgi:ketosteroid isomerase-like protein
MAVGREREDAVIRRVIEGWAAGVRARKIGGVVAHHTDDMVKFDVPPPVVVHGIAAYRRTWPPFSDGYEMRTAGSTSSS